jgi:hypothetical protein
MKKNPPSLKHKQNVAESQAAMQQFGTISEKLAFKTGEKAAAQFIRILNQSTESKKLISADNILEDLYGMIEAGKITVAQANRCRQELLQIAQLQIPVVNQLHSRRK